LRASKRPSPRKPILPSASNTESGMSAENGWGRMCGIVRQRTSGLLLKQRGATNHDARAYALQ